jgi:hypothetical protein
MMTCAHNEGDNRRQAVRISVPAKSHVVTGGEVVCNAEVLDVSEGGIAVRMRQPLPIGAAVLFCSPVAKQSAEVIGCDAMGEGWHRVRFRWTAQDNADAA